MARASKASSTTGRATSRNGDGAVARVLCFGEIVFVFIQYCSNIYTTIILVKIDALILNDIILKQYIISTETPSNHSRTIVKILKFTHFFTILLTPCTAFGTS